MKRITVEVSVSVWLSDSEGRCVVPRRSVALLDLHDLRVSQSLAPLMRRASAGPRRGLAQSDSARSLTATRRRVAIVDLNQCHLRKLAPPIELDEQ